MIETSQRPQEDQQQNRVPTKTPPTAEETSVRPSEEARAKVVENAAPE